MQLYVASCALFHLFTSSPFLCLSSLCVLPVRLFCPNLCLAQPSVCPIPSPRLTGVPGIIGEQFLLQPYACFKINYHMLSNTVKTNKQKKTHSLLKDQKSNLTPSAREIMFLGGPCRKLCISTYQGCLGNTGLRPAFSRLMF